MKFPTLTRLPKYKRFHYQPRYYDPIKEDIEHRTARIRKELGITPNEVSESSSPIRGAFTQQKRSTTNKGSGLLQVLIMFILSGLFAGYFLYGNDIFYVFFIFVPIYIYVRGKKLFKSKER